MHVLSPRQVSPAIVVQAEPISIIAWASRHDVQPALTWLIIVAMQSVEEQLDAQGEPVAQPQSFSS
jgi:hypothetical protein